MSERCYYMASLGVEPSLSDKELTATLTTIYLRSIYGTDSPSTTRPASRLR
jgi:hypothetical protein